MIERAAGGVVYRRSDTGIDVLLIHDRYGKIALPKGKEEPGETPEETAVREIEEETGIVASIETMLEETAYTYRKPDGETVNKTVRFYLLQARGGELAAQVEEIRDVSWVPLEEAIRLQQAAGYATNDVVFREALARLTQA